MNFHAYEGALSPKRRLLYKIGLIMRLTAFFLLVAALHVSAKSFSQNVSISGKDLTLKQILQAIKHQTGYEYIGDQTAIVNAPRVSVDFNDAPLSEVLDKCLGNIGFSYEIVEKTIIIKPKNPVPGVQSGNSTPVPAAPSTDIHGRVTDSAGNPLAGASITVQGTKTIVETNRNGDFTLANTNGQATLLVSYVGYDTRTIKLNGTETNKLTITLRHNNNPLDELQVIAYGTNTKRYSVGSVSSVNANTIEQQPVTNMLLALEGQAPGLAINATSGVPGSRIEVQIRGQNTLQSSPTGIGYKPYDQPLFIIDGVPFAPQNNNVSQFTSLATANGVTGGINQFGGVSPFDNINPNDIESISILKDADATSIYGTQGSNGVILITTKKGKPGKTTFQLTATTGFNTDTRKLKLLNTQQYLQLRNDAFTADGLVPSNNPAFAGYTYAPDLTIFDSTKYTDWQKVIFGKTSNNTDIHGTLSGGTVNNTFLIAGGFTRSDFNYPGNFAAQRVSLHTAFHHASTDNRLTADFGMDYGYDQNNSGQFGGAQSILLPPNTPDLLDAQGNLVWTYKGVNIGNYQFYSYLKQPVGLDNYNLNTYLRLGYKICTGLSITANLGYSRNTSNEHSEDPLVAQYPLYANARASFGTNDFETINVEPQLDYTAKIGKGVLTALVGATYKKNLNTSTELDGSGYANDNFLGSINGAAYVSAEDNSTIYKYSAGFSRLKYVYNRKYIISLTGRRDGSSNFGPGHQFGNFGSAGAGWIFSEEKAFKSTLPVISYAKLSGNYGTSGSDGIAPYHYQSFWQPISDVPAFQGSQPDLPQNLYNPNYSWAVKKSLNVALDLGFFHDRVLLNATYYRDREGNQLGGYPLAIQTGFTQVLENLPANVQNAGWEFSATSTQIKTKNFSWSSTFNITFNRNKLLSYPNLSSSPFAYSYVVGKPTSEVIGYKFAGVNPATGLFNYYTSKGQDTISPTYGLASQGGDLAPIADREVKYMGGFGNTFSYKRFSLYVFIQFSSQTAPNYLYTVYSNYFPGLSISNQPKQVLDYWKNPGDHTTFQKLTAFGGSEAFTAESNFSSSSGAYSDDTYARLKTVALSYSLPDAFLKKAHIQGCRIYVNVQNLLTITDYKVSDPEEFNDYTAFPLQRIVAFGLNFNF
jgi:TonB-linked SusC/RagA family outer membrane protein